MPRVAAYASNDPETRILAGIEKDANGCWIWTGKIDRDGYGRISIRGCSRRVHWISYEVFIGAIPNGKMIDHLCRARSCCRPDHLEPVSHAINMGRSERASRTSCRNGHPYDDKNTFDRKDGARICRTCSRAATQRYRLRKRLATKGASH